MGKMNVSIVEEVPYGVYLWETADGKLVKDGEGRFLCIAAIKGDVKKIKKLKQVAKHYGLEDGSPIWMSGHRPITDEEYDHQRQRMDWGLIPDEWDLPALEEDMKSKWRQGIV